MEVHLVILRQKQNPMLHLKFCQHIREGSISKGCIKFEPAAKPKPKPAPAPEPDVAVVTDFLTGMKDDVIDKKPKAEPESYIGKKIEEQEKIQEVGAIKSFLDETIQQIINGPDEGAPEIEEPEIDADNLKNVDIDLRLKYILSQSKGNEIPADGPLAHNKINVSKDELINTFGMTQEIDAAEGGSSGVKKKKRDAAIKVEMLNLKSLKMF